MRLALSFYINPNRKCLSNCEEKTLKNYLKY